jgi:prepilin-type N-terminal cleavage/methylation domain-containing protein
MRRGFTLIEILIVIGIIVLLTVLAVASFIGMDSQRVRNGARVAQSAIMGARDRALHAKGERGIRILLDSQNPNIGTGFVYIWPVESLKFGKAANSGLVRFDNLDLLDATGAPGTDGVMDTLRITGLSDPKWSELQAFPAFSTPPLLRYPVKDGRWKQWQNLRTPPATAPGTESVDVPVADIAFTSEGSPSSSLTLNENSEHATVEFRMFNEQTPANSPIALPSGVVIDLNYSSAAAKGDMLFSPAGPMLGSVASQGPIYLLLRDIRDVADGINPATVAAVHRDTLIIAIIPLTGNCHSYPVDRTDTDNNGTADDLFRYAKLGSAAGG